MGPATPSLSDKSWRTCPGPITFSSVYGGEDYDARREQAGWDTPGFRDDSWQGVLEVQGPSDELMAEQAPPIEVLHTYQPVKITQPQPNVTVYDLGQNFSERPEITVRGDRGVVVDMIAGELLDASGLVTQHSASASPQSENRFSYTPRGGGRESWHPRFSYWFTGKLAHPPGTSGPFQNMGLREQSGRPPAAPPPEFYADSVVVAFRVPSGEAADDAAQATITCSGEGLDAGCSATATSRRPQRYLFRLLARNRGYGSNILRHIPLGQLPM